MFKFEHLEIDVCCWSNGQDASSDYAFRDLTINTLIYNLQHDILEDFSGMGLPDLQKKHLRTPIQALNVLMNDPLSLLRIVRFSLLHGFTINQDIHKAAPCASKLFSTLTKGLLYILLSFTRY